MKQTRERFIICMVPFVIFLIMTYTVFAVGTYITEYPFSGTYRVSCGYHQACYATSTPVPAGTATPTPRPTAWGLDFVNNSGGTYGDVVYASGRGTINAAGSEGDWGNRVIIDHPDTYYSRYAHLSYIFTLKDHKMAEGSPIGYMGSTGNSSGDHLHFQVYNNTTTGPGVEPIPIDGKNTSFCRYPHSCGPYTNSGFVTDMRLVDNVDSGFALTGGGATCYDNISNGFDRLGLSVSPSPVYYRYCNASSPANRTGTWTPALPSSGNYRIYAFIPNSYNVTLTENADYRIYINNSWQYTIRINQEAYSNKWVYLGMFWLGTSGSYVRLTNAPIDGKRTAFDAVMFVNVTIVQSEPKWLKNTKNKCL